jgi:diadenosine tetraphosphate (Ap4A) HIT family hydrolase
MPPSLLQTPSRTDCTLCSGEGGVLLVRRPELRVVRVEDPDYPAYLRVIWNAHVTEMSDLAETERARLMAAVNVVEMALRQIMEPDKINLASLGNQVPHLHWHMIARFCDDAHYPQPIWAERQRDASATRLMECRQRLPALAARIVELMVAD